MAGFIVLLVIVIVIALIFYGKYVRQRTAAASTNRQHERACALLQDEFIVVDLETTGLDPTRHTIIEIGAIRVTPVMIAAPTATAQTYQALVKTKKKLPVKITEITGLTKEVLDKDGDELPDVLKGFLAFVGERRIVTYNAEFDMAFLHAACDSLKMPRLRNPVSCALIMSRAAFPQLKNHRLATLAQMLGKTQTHRAIGDAHVALIAYVAAVGILGRV